MTDRPTSGGRWYRDPATRDLTRDEPAAPAEPAHAPDPAPAPASAPKRK